MANRISPPVSIRFDLMDTTQEEIYDLLKKTGKRSELVTLALTELMDKYGLHSAEKKDIKAFLNGYEFIKKKKEG